MRRGFEDEPRERRRFQQRRQCREQASEPGGLDAEDRILERQLGAFQTGGTRRRRGERVEREVGPAVEQEPGEKGAIPPGDQGGQAQFRARIGRRAVLRSDGRDDPLTYSSG